MKRIMCTIAMIVFAATVSFAQASKNEKSSGVPSRRVPATPEQAATDRSKAIQKLVGLTDAQYQQVYTAELECNTQVKAATQPGSRNPDVTQFRTARDEKYKSIMNAEQYTKYIRSGGSFATEYTNGGRN